MYIHCNVTPVPNRLVQKLTPPAERASKFNLMSPLGKIAYLYMFPDTSTHVISRRKDSGALVNYDKIQKNKRNSWHISATSRFHIRLGSYWCTELKYYHRWVLPWVLARINGSGVWPLWLQMVQTDEISSDSYYCQLNVIQISVLYEKSQWQGYDTTNKPTAVMHSLQN